MRLSSSTGELGLAECAAEITKIIRVVFVIRKFK